MNPLVALDVERDHARVLAAHEALGQFVLRMARQSRIPDEAHGRTPFEEFRHRLRGAAVLSHAQRRRRQPARHQPGVERAEDAAVVDHGLFLDLRQQLAAPQHAAAERIAVAVDVLGHAVDLEVGPVLERAQAERPGERGVDGKQRPRFVSDPRQRVEVGDARGRVAGRFGVDQLRVGAHGAAYRLRVGDVHERYLDAVLFRQKLAELQVRGAVTDLGNDGVIARVEKRGEHAHQRRHAAGEHRAVLRAGEGAEPVLQHHLVDVAVALVDVAVDAAPVDGRAVGGNAVVGRHVDRRVDRAESIVPARAGVNRQRVDAQFPFHEKTPLFCR